MANIIKRVQHFESEGTKYTAWITVDDEDNPIYRISNNVKNTPPTVIIKNDDEPNNIYCDVICSNDFINIYHSYKTDLGIYTDSFEYAYDELNEIEFDKQYNILTIFPKDEEESVIEIPCNDILTAYILSSCLMSDLITEFDYFWKEHGFSETDFFEIED